jgi:hypothetical protein
MYSFSRENEKTRVTDNKPTLAKPPRCMHSSPHSKPAGRTAFAGPVGLKVPRRPGSSIPTDAHHGHSAPYAERDFAAGMTPLRRHRPRPSRLPQLPG